MRNYLSQFRNKIIWKIMLIFWLTTICIIISNILITTEIVMNENKAERLKETMTQLASDAVLVYERNGQPALRKWYKNIRAKHGLTVLLYDSNQSPLGEPPEKAKRQHHEHRGFFAERRYMEKLLNLMGQPYRSATGDSYYLKLLPSRRLTKQFRPPTLLHVSRIGISFLFIFLGSWWIARSISRPVGILRNASQKVADGELNTRVAPEIGPRKDELGELAKAFDHMAERITHLLAAQRQLFSDISHDIRTPLTRQKLAIELARESENPGPMLDKLEHQNQLIEQLLDSLLTLLRLDDEGNQRSKQAINVTELLEMVVHQAELEASSKGIEIRPKLAPNLSIQGQRDLLLRAVNNLLSNAIKYSPSGSTVDVEASLNAQGLEITVRDQGPGIPEDQLSKVLEPFYRTDSSRNSENGGYGLGLSIANKIVQQHHGELALKNRTDGGLEVLITLPTSDTQK